MTHLNTSHELEYDPDKELSDDEFRQYFPNSGDLPEHSFSDDDLAYRYATLYGLCVYNADTMECVYCRRDDH